MIVGFMTFTFTLLLHASSSAGPRDARDRRRPAMPAFSDAYLRERPSRSSTGLDVGARGGCSPGCTTCASGPGGCSSSASVARPAHASHAVNDFRKICGLEAYAPDRQRRRADRPHQRRRVGRLVRRVAGGLTSRADGRVLGLLGRRRRPRAQHLGEPHPRARPRTQPGAPSSASSAATVATPPGRTPRVRGGPADSRRAHAAHRRPVRGGVAPDREPPRCCRAADEMGVHAVNVPIDDRSTASGSSSAARVSSAVTSSIGCSPRPSTGVTIYDNFTSGRDRGTYAHHADDPGSDRPRRRQRRRRPQSEVVGHDVVIHLASNPDIAAAMTDPDIDFLAGHAAHA